jgi:hypothetical protein
MTVNELIIPYKGRYYRIRQFLQNKPIRFGIKVWALASSASRFVTDVSIYEGKGSIANSEEGFMYDVVMNLIKGLDQKWHTICMDNLFSSPRLFHDILVLGFWATRTLWANRVGVSKAIASNRGELGRWGSLVIKMRKHRQMTIMS